MSIHLRNCQQQNGPVNHAAALAKRGKGMYAKNEHDYLRVVEEERDRVARTQEQRLARRNSDDARLVLCDVFD